MKLLKESKHLIEYILPNYDKCLLKQYNDSVYNNKINNILQVLYRDILISNKNFHNNKDNFKVKNKKKFNIPNITSNFIPIYIKDYINDNGFHQINYEFFINNKKINIYIMLYNSNDLLNIDKYNKWFYNMYLILYICTLYSSSECSKILNIYLFPTHYKKELPTNRNIIGPNNVNTAYTKRCQPDGEIIIFRREEWFKVFIHECIHSFGLDINRNIEEKINKQLSDIFSLNIDFSISEAYTETWARILNITVACFNNTKKHKNKQKKFIEQTTFFLQLEKIFSIIQLNKILKNMNLTYNLITNKNNKNIIICQNLYKQNTHVFGYYIITAILLNKSTEFMDYCIKNNLSFLKFNQTNNNANQLIKFIKKSYKAKMLTECEKTFADSNKSSFIKNNMRMTAIEFI